MTAPWIIILERLFTKGQFSYAEELRFMKTDKLKKKGRGVS